MVINITTGGSPVLPLADRMAPALRFKPEVASLNMGSMNFGMYELLERFKEFQHAWERPYLEGSSDLIFKNTFKDIEHILTSCGDNRTRFEIECYDIGHLYTAAHFVDRKLLKPPLPDPVGIRHTRHRHASRRRDDDEAHRGPAVRRQLHLVGAGRRAQADAPGDDGRHARRQRARGLEDSLWDGPDELARSNADQVRRIRRILEDLSLQVATPDEARETLQLKGRDNVAF